MKKIFLTSFLLCNLLFFHRVAFAGGVGCPSCTPAVGACSGFIGAVCTDTLPVATAGVAYSENFTFQVVAGIDTVLPILGPITINTTEARLVGVTGLPQGLTWQSSSTNVNGDTSFFYPSFDTLSSQYACLSICGTPCGANDTLTLTLDFEYDLSIPALGEFLLPNSLTVVLILSSPIPQLNITSASDFLCPSGAGTTVDLTATNGFVSYTWSTGSTNDMITASTPDTYSVTTTDNLGCTQEASKEIAILGAIVNADTTICANTITQLLADGGDSFSWTPSTNLSSATEQNPVLIAMTASNTYTVTVSNQNCNDQASVTVTIDNAGCPTVCTGCSPNASLCTGLTEPSLCEPLPNITAGVAYDEQVTFYLPSTISVASVLPIPIEIPGIPTSAGVKDVSIDGISGLPAGFEWECDQEGNDCVYFPSLYPSVTQYGCISICGTTCGSGPDSVNMEISLTILLDLTQEVIDLIANVQAGFDGHVSFPIAASTYLEYADDLEITPAGTVTITQGETVTLTATSAGFSGHVWSNGASGTSITVNTAGSYTVTANDGACDQTESVTVQVVAGVEDLTDLSNSFGVSPNPSTGACEASFDLKNSEQVTIAILTIEGKQAMTFTHDGTFGKNTLPLDLSTLAKGTYFVKLTSEAGSVNKRVTVY